MIALAHEFALGRCPTTGTRATGSSPSQRTEPMRILPHLAVCLAGAALLARTARLAAELAEARAGLTEVTAGLDALNLGVIDADLNGSRANARADELEGRLDAQDEAWTAWRAMNGRDADTLEEVPGGIRADGLPADHPESMALELSPEHEVMLAGYATDMWPADEYEQIVAEDFRQRNGGAG